MKRFNRVLKSARLPHFRMYDTRHTYATLLLDRHAPIAYGTKQLGHAKPETTLRFYTDWLPDEDPGYVERLDREWNQNDEKWRALGDSNLRPTDS